MELTFLLEECSDAFRRTDEYRRLKEHRPKERSLLVDERTAINVCVQQTFLSVYKIMKGEDESFDEEDLVVCALGAMGFKTAVIADCLSVSAEAVKGLVINCFMPMASVEVQSCASLTNDIICWR